MSTFRNALVFFDQLGVYDVVLPFLLIFTLVYAMMEKTKVFGEFHKHEDGQEVHKTRKNLNAMIAFVSAFLVVASSQLVAVINYTIAKSMVLLVMAVLFMVLIGVFHKGKEELFLEGAWKNVFMIIMFIGISLILLYNLGWLQFVYMYAGNNLSGPVVGSFALLIITLGFMLWVTHEKSDKPESKGSSGGGH